MAAPPRSSTWPMARNRGEPLEDLVQVGTIGLLKAIDRFDLEREVEFSTYATLTIVGEFAATSATRAGAVPRRLQELNLSLNKVVAELSQEIGRPQHRRDRHQGPPARRGGAGPGHLQRLRRGLLDALPPARSPLVSEHIGVEDEPEALEYWAALGPLIAGLPERAASHPLPPLLRRHDPVPDRRLLGHLPDARQPAPELTLAILREGLLEDEEMARPVVVPPPTARPAGSKGRQRDRVVAALAAWRAWSCSRPAIPGRRSSWPPRPWPAGPRWWPCSAATAPSTRWSTGSATPRPRSACSAGGRVNVVARGLGLPADLTGSPPAWSSCWRRRSSPPDPRWSATAASSSTPASASAGRSSARSSAAGGRAALRRPRAVAAAALLALLVGHDREHPHLTVHPPDGRPPLRGFFTLVGNGDPFTYLGRRPLRPTPQATWDGGLDLLVGQTMATRALARPSAACSRPTHGPATWACRSSTTSTLRWNRTFPAVPARRRICRRPDQRGIQLPPGRPRRGRRPRRA